MSSAGEASSYSRVAGCVLQAETCLVSLCDLLSSGDVQQVIVAEGLHTVVMPEDTHIQCGTEVTFAVIFISSFIF